MSNPKYWRLYYKVQGALILEYGDNRGYMVEATNITSSLLQGTVPTSELYLAISSKVSI